MLTAFSSDPVVEFRHNLESVNGEVHMVQGWAEVPFLLESLALEAGWQSLVVPEEALRARLSGDGSSLLRGEPFLVKGRPWSPVVPPWRLPRDQWWSPPL